MQEWRRGWHRLNLSEGVAIRYTIQINFTDSTPTNNIAEYEGLLTGLRIAISLGIK